MDDAKPPYPSADIARFIGLYGTDRALLDIYEVDGVLLAEGCGLASQPIDADRLRLSDQPVATAVIDGKVLEQRDFAGAAVAHFRRAIFADFDRLRAESIAAQPPVWPASAAKSDLVEIHVVDPSIEIDMRYASTNNFMGVALYDRASAFLQHPAAAALARAQASLRNRGFRLIVLDAYRPWSVTWLFWQAVPPEARQFVADPTLGSKHNRGCAVDVALIEIADGTMATMPSDYDEASARAGPDYRGSTSRARWHRDLLRAAMENAGFTVDPHEWWHYDFGDWQSYPVLNTPLAALG